MSVSTRIEAIEQHLTDDYSVLTLAGADLTNVDKNIINLKPTWQERLLYFINNGTDVVWNNWEKVEGTGESLSLNSTEEAPMKTNLKGNTSQEGTPTPETPQDIHVVSGDNSIDVCGKNLWGEEEHGGIDESTGVDFYNATRWRTVGFISAQPNTSYTISSNASSSIWYIFYYYDKNKNFISSKPLLGTTSVNWETPSNCEYMRCVIADTASITTTQRQLEVGSTATTYEPYKGASYHITLPEGMFLGWIPNTTYQDKIDKSTGKNLFDKNNANVLDGMFINAVAGNIGSNANATSIYIPINPNTTYCVSKTKGNRFAIGYSSTTPAVNVSLTNIVDDRTKTSLTSTSSSDSKYLVIYISLSDTETYENIISTIQIEYGNTPTDFEPYGKVWYLNKQIGKVVLNGSEAWTKSSNTNVNRYYIPGIFINTILNVSTIDLISDYFTCITPIQSDAYNVGLAKLNNTSIMVNFDLSNISFDTLEKYKTWLSAHNTEVYYVLATPTTTEITDSTLISQLETVKRSFNGQTNISQENNDKPFILDVTALKQLTQ